MNALVYVDIVQSIREKSSTKRKTEKEILGFHIPRYMDGVENDPHRKMIPILKSENDPHIYFGNNFEENDPHTKKGNDPHIYFGKILKENYTHAIAFSDIT